MAMPDLQWYHENLNLIKEVYDTVRFSIVSLKQEMRKSLSQKTANENKQFEETKILISISYSK